MRLAVAGFAHESNTFHSQPTGMKDFGVDENGVKEGERILSHYADTFHEIAGYIAGAEQFGYEIFPIIAAGATPAAAVTAEAYDYFTGRILDGLRTGPKVDGVLLALHGAMVADGYPHADAETVRRVRELVGPDMPIAVTHDYHANVPPELVEAADVLVIYKTNPHIDQRERGLQAASILVQMVKGEVKPVMALAKPELLFNIYYHNTSAAPMQSLMQAAIDMEAQEGILACSIAAGYQYADVPHMGPSIVVIADGDEALAQRAAQRLEEAMWAVREDLKPQVATPQEAVTLAMQSDEQPVCLLDFGDNIGGGSAGDSTFVLEELIEQDAEKWVVTLWDPESAAACFVVGVGADIELQAGAKTDAVHGATLAIRGRVRTLHDGSYEETERRHGGGRFFNQGPTAVVDVGGKGLLVLNSVRSSPNSLHQITCMGIQPQQQKILVAKGAVAPRAAYEPVCARLIEVASGGATAILRGPDDYKLARKTLYEWG
ncbi:MAG: microcystin degradation protein MlrC [Candidatus Latescibacterota bacterium]|jgi:microcystin degradation protein MlrC